MLGHGTITVTARPYHEIYEICSSELLFVYLRQIDHTTTNNAMRELYICIACRQGWDYKALLLTLGKVC
jgi:hypothetical protein